MDFSSYSSEKSKIFLEIINKVRRQHYLKEIIFKQYLLPTPDGIIGSENNFENEIHFIFGSIYVWEHFKTLKVKTRDDFTEYENSLFAKIVNDYLISIGEIKIDFPDEKQSIHYYLNLMTAKNVLETEWDQNQVETFFEILNKERSKRGYDPILIPSNVLIEKAMDWFFDKKLAEVPEFNKKEDTVLYRTVKVWSVIHVVFPEGCGFNFNEVEVYNLGVFTHKQDAIYYFQSLEELNPEELFSLQENYMNREIDLYLPPEEPDWYKEMY